jgi:hypothetical protein
VTSLHAAGEDRRRCANTAPVRRAIAARQGFIYTIAMKRATKNLGGRPRVDSVKFIMAVPPQEMADIERWIALQNEEMTRQEAIRRLVKLALDGRKR